MESNIVTQFLLALIAALLGGIAYFIKKILENTTALECQFKPVVPAIMEIQGKFKDAGHNLLFPLTVTPGSPLRITGYGRKLVEESGFDKILQANRQKLVRHVRATKPRTNYDIQQNSVATIKAMLDGNEEILKPLKDYAFNNGLDVEIIALPAGILLRDEVMKDLKL